MTDRTLGITAVIDSNRMSGFQAMIVALCALIGFVEGFDINSAGYVAPALAKAWLLKPGVLGVFFSTGLFGLMLGALFIAPIADRIGRKPVLIASLVTFGVASLAASMSPSLQILIPVWFFTGLGVGGAMPNAVAVTSEYVPHRIRSLMVVLAFDGFLTGSIIAGLTAVGLIKIMGWPIVWRVGGVLPLILAPILWAFLPESVRFLAGRPERQGEIAALMRRIDPDAPPGVRYVLDEPAGKVSVRALFAAGHARRTILLWIIVFCSLLDLFLMANWLPTQIGSLGVAAPVALALGALLQVGGLTGTGLGWSVDRFGPAPTLIAAYILGALAIGGIALSGGHVPALAASILVAGFGIVGGQGAANAVAAMSYPTEIRSTGVGWYFGIGRIGSIIGPGIAGVLLAAGVTNRDLFLMAVVPALVAAAAAFLLSRD